jgi:aryl-alcohol dehydrogenase-like predicted oxidoreductase
MAQLKTAIDAADVTLTPEVVAAIEAIHTQIPNPCP